MKKYRWNKKKCFYNLGMLALLTMFYIGWFYVELHPEKFDTRYMKHLRQLL